MTIIREKWLSTKIYPKGNFIKIIYNFSECEIIVWWLSKSISAYRYKNKIIAQKGFLDNPKLKIFKDILETENKNIKYLEFNKFFDLASILLEKYCLE